MSKEYLRQETVEPAKALGRQARLGFGGAFLLALGAVLAVWAVYFVLVNEVFVGEWGRVWAKLLTALAAAIGAALVAWQMSKPAKGELE